MKEKVKTLLTFCFKKTDSMDIWLNEPQKNTHPRKSTITHY